MPNIFKHFLGPVRAYTFPAAEDIEIEEDPPVEEGLPEEEEPAAATEEEQAQEEELATKSARLEELNALLNMDQRDNEMAEPSAEEMEEQNDRNAPRRSRGVER